MRIKSVKILEKIMLPIINSIEKCHLHQDLPITKGREDNQIFALLECFGRSFAGVAPYLNSSVPSQEAPFHKRLKDAMVQGLINGVSETKDAFNFKEGAQPIVDASFLVLGLLRSFDTIWMPLDLSIKKRIIESLKQTRVRKPAFCNWLLFSGLIELFLYKVGEADWDPMRVDFAIRQHEQWYLGDGVYADGPEYHNDYYNSFVIHPYLIEMMRVLQDSPKNQWSKFSENIMSRAKRFAVIQERTINIDGTYPVYGRSIAYRSGVFHHLSAMALYNLLPEEISPAQVRCALSAMISRLFDGEQNFNKDGYLGIGLNGMQQEISESYINHGSIYLALCGFCHLGLPAEDIFWSSPDEEWSSVKAWGGKWIKADHSL